jgi:hypothetical protein
MQEPQRPRCSLLLVLLCPTRLAMGRPVLVLTKLQGPQTVQLLRTVIGHRPIPLLQELQHYWLEVHLGKR